MKFDAREITLKDGRNTGSVIISRFLTGPGHYEVKMKPLPRLGACTALWTYTNRVSSIYDENDNHEIDIELPGGKTNNAISFKNVLIMINIRFQWCKNTPYNSHGEFL